MKQSVTDGLEWAGLVRGPVTGFREINVLLPWRFITAGNSVIHLTTAQGQISCFKLDSHVIVYLLIGRQNDS